MFNLTNLCGFMAYHAEEVGGPVFGNVDWVNEMSMVWCTGGDTLTTYSGEPPTFVAPANGWFYDGDYGGCDACTRGVRLVTPRPFASIEVDVYSPEDMQWGLSYTLIIAGSLGSYTEQSSFNVPPVPAGILPIGTYTFVVDISALGDLHTVMLYYGRSDGSGDRAFVFTDIRVA